MALQPLRLHYGTPRERFWAKVNKDGPTVRAELGPCWAWTADRNHKGYGRLQLGGNVVELAHRYSWALHVGPIPEGMLVCHHCDNPVCVRPEHLFVGTAKDNTADMIAKGRQKFWPSPRRF